MKKIVTFTLMGILMVTATTTAFALSFQDVRQFAYPDESIPNYYDTISPKYHMEYTGEFETITLGPCSFTNVHYFEVIDSFNNAGEYIPELYFLYVSSEGSTMTINEDKSRTEFVIVDTVRWEPGWDIYQVVREDEGYWETGEQNAGLTRYIDLDLLHIEAEFTKDSDNLMNAGATFTFPDYENIGLGGGMITVYIDEVPYNFGVAIEPTKGFYCNTWVEEPEVLATPLRASTETTFNPFYSIYAEYQAKTGTATSSASKVMVDGESYTMQSYNISGNQYFKLRDIAMALSGTNRQFDVEWNTTHEVTNMVRYKAYEPIGGELEVSASKTAAYTEFTEGTYLEWDWFNLETYIIDGEKYAQLRGLGEIMYFDVSWDSVNKCIMVDTNEVYQG